MKTLNSISKIILVNKPIGWTSFDVVKRVRATVKKIYNLKNLKVGHCGTLDPLASGDTPTEMDKINLSSESLWSKYIKLLEDFLNMQYMPK